VTATVRFGAALPPGFLAVAADTMIWGDADSFCTNQGGSLPSVAGLTIGDTVDGFGSIGGSWPSGLPSGSGVHYWSGTASGGGYYYIWNSNGVQATSASVNNLKGAACVP
jgi:hypothetical protein